MAKCQCGREMLQANGCRFNRIAVLKAKADKSSDTLKAELTKQAMKAKNVRWLVKIEFHE